MITVYTDGSSLGNPGPGGRGVLIVGAAHVDQQGGLSQRKKTLSGGEKHTTNNRMELSAIIHALHFLVSQGLAHRDISVHTDSMYARDGITMYLPLRVAKNRKRDGNKPVLNQDLWEQIHTLLPLFPHIHRQWVKAHADNAYNNAVDILARGEAQKQK